MLDLIKKLIANDKIRYLIAGGCTTFVNLIMFFILRTFTGIERNACNAIAIVMAITFAYFANKFFVFESKKLGTSATIAEAVSFVGARLISMAVEILGFAILCDSFRFNEVISKILVQVVVLVLNYLFSKLLVFNKKRRTFGEHIKDNYCYYLSFLIVAVIMLAIFIAEKITPFGTRTLTIVDSLHQYLPFFSDYRDKLLNEGSLFYSWNIALGSNFMSLSAYYLSSPFNYLLLLFDKEHIAAGACIIMALKISLTAVAMAYYLSHKDGKKVRNLGIVAIAVSYALSNYVVGYYWNTMWLDCIMAFPLVILGFDKLMKEGNPKLYAIAMFYTLYCNYYIGFIVCLFMVLWFFAYKHGGIKKFFIDGVRFAVYSLVSGGMAAFMLIPAYFGIMSTASAKADLPKWKWYGDIFQMFKQQLFLTEPITNQTFDGGVNLYCGMLAVFAMFLYIFTGRIKLSEKIRKVVLLAILMISFNSETLNFIWHGMHNQYGIPNRFSFLYVFILLVIAYDVLRYIGDMHVLYIISGALLSGAFVLMCRLKGGSSVTTLIITTSMIMLLLYAVVCCLRAGRVIKKKVFMTLISIICVAEVSVNAVYGFLQNGYADLTGYYSTSPDVTEAYEAVEALAEESDAGFYRAELMDSTVLDEATWHNMPSVGTFCSTVLGEVVTTMGRIGFYTGANEFLYMGSTPFPNSLFNVRYLLEREGDLNNYDFDYVETVSNVGIYENPYPLSIGFCVSDNVKEWDRNAGLPLNCQSSLAYQMTGCEDYFTDVWPSIVVSSDTCSTTINGNTINYTPYEAGNASLMISFSIEQAGDYYVNCRGNSINKVRFYINGQEYAYDRYQIQIFHLGELKEGDYVSIEYCYKNISKSPATASLYMSIYDEEKYKLHYEKLSDNMLDVIEYDDGYIYGEVDMPEGETLFTTVPYDEGWSVLVDGKEAEYYTVAGAFIGIDMEPGHHTVEMSYIPKGLYPGIAIAVVSWAILMLGVMHNTNKKRNKKLVKNNNNEIDREVNI